MAKMCLFVVGLLAFITATGCSGRDKSPGGKAGTGDPKADLGKIWSACKDHYRKTKAMPAPAEIPDGLAAKYNYESTAGISLNKHSTSVIAYESKSSSGKRHVLFSDGRIESVTDKQLEDVGVDPNPKGSGQP